MKEMKPEHYSTRLMRQMKDEWEKTKRKWIDPESYEEGKDPHYDDWKNDEQGRRMQEEIERLLSEEKAEKK